MNHPQNARKSGKRAATAPQKAVTPSQASLEAAIKVEAIQESAIRRARNSLTVNHDKELAMAAAMAILRRAADRVAAVREAVPEED